eukprot:TRINITY_DN109123_c2_g1_i1.p1 TRINITY_DN109123_c2_g1~~TRINITY_DN109123_c2_g1_i1.p1  ORF type:complete len:159 (+),score=20.28 TRINITY_DN109123_c2_g1_i1:111-587(+)
MTTTSVQFRYFVFAVVGGAFFLSSLAKAAETATTVAKATTVAPTTEAPTDCSSSCTDILCATAEKESKDKVLTTCQKEKTCTDDCKDAFVDLYKKKCFNCKYSCPKVDEQSRVSPTKTLIDRAADSFECPDSVKKSASSIPQNWLLVAGLLSFGVVVM